MALQPEEFVIRYDLLQRQPREARQEDTANQPRALPGCQGQRPWLVLRLGASAQSGDGGSTRSMTRTSTEARPDSSFKPS
jgi:hypothetical protein